MKISVKLDEQETVISLAPRSVGKSFIYSCEPDMKKRILKLAEKFPEGLIIEKIDEDGVGIQATCTRDWFKFSPPRSLTMTAERKAELAERLKHAREMKDK